MICSRNGLAATTNDSVMVSKRWFRMATVDLRKKDVFERRVQMLEETLRELENVKEKLVRDTVVKSQHIGFLEAKLESSTTANTILTNNCNNQLRDKQREIRRIKTRSTISTIIFTTAGVIAGYVIKSILH